MITNTKTRTAAQTAAIEADDTEIVLLAGPGSGKTTTLISRIAHRILRKAAHPKKIVCITFTNAAADEMAKRMEGGIELGYIGTLHGFALKQLQRFGRQIGYGERVSLIDEEEGRALMEAIARELKVTQSIDHLWSMKAQGRPTQPRLSRDHLVVAEYFDRLKQQSTADFDVLLTEFRTLLKSGAGRELSTEFAELYVDEFQDSGPVDFEIYELLPIARKFYVGDPDQSIFGFRGADVGGILKKAKQTGVHCIKLEQNFRSLPEICQAAQRLIEVNAVRADKKTISASFETWATGRVIVERPLMNERAEIDRVIEILEREIAAKDVPHMRPDWSDMAILTRSNALAYSFREALRARTIPLAEPPRRDLPQQFGLLIAALTFLADPDNNLHAERYVRALMGPENAESQRRDAARKGVTINSLHMRFPQGIRAVDTPKWIRDIGLPGESSMFVSEKLRTMRATDETTISELALRLMQREEVADEKPAGVTVSTMHAAKGREWDVVILPAFEEEVIPSTRREVNYPEERRLAYVALTRARHRVYVTTAAERVAKWGGVRVHRPSRFIGELTGNNS
jgi:DNA helicase-2/ATP-dependent DNA helicase PcrA